MTRVLGCDIEIIMNKFLQEKKTKIGKSVLKEKERIDFENFVRVQLLKLKERGLSLPIATL